MPFFGPAHTQNLSASLDGTNVVHGVTRIDLPSCDWGVSLRAEAANPATASEVPQFIAGPENRLVVPALERLLAVEDLAAASTLFNPLVLIGSSGTGKSHLARGITRRWQSLLGDETVEYLTAADFARQLRDARDEGVLEEFRERKTELQLLVLEDLHRLSPRAFVQRELRDTLDVLNESGAVVVITTQQPPAAIVGLEAGLRDRLASGLTLRLQSPGLEARLELLALTATQRGMQINDDQLRQLAHKVTGPAPQLSRAIAEFELVASNTADLAETRAPLQFKQIVAVVARYYSLTQAALCSPARRKSLVQARAVAIHLARTLTDLTYAQIGHSLGRRDHTTILHAARTMEKQLSTDARCQQDIEELKRILTAV